MKLWAKALASCLAAACMGMGLTSAAQGAVSTPAWAPIAASGPTNLPPAQSEVTRLAVDAEAGDFALTARTIAGAGTANLSAKSTFVIVDVEAGAFATGQSLLGEHIAPGTTITGKIGLAIVLSQPTTNTTAVANVHLSSVTAGGATTSALAFDSEPSELEAALNGLATIGGEGASVSVSGGPGDKGAEHPYFITFGGTAADTDLPAVGRPLLEVDDSGLGGGIASAANLTTALDGGRGTTQIAVYAQNVGGVTSEGTTELALTLPEDIVTTGTPSGGGWSCSPGGEGNEELACASTRETGPGFTLPPLMVTVRAEAGAESGIVEVAASGGGAVGAATFEMPLVISAIPSPPGVQSVSAAPYSEDGTIASEAGAHPYSASAGVLVNTVRATNGRTVPAGELRDIVVNTPPGFFGNPTAVGACPESFEQPAPVAPPERECEQDSIVATVQVPLQDFGSSGELSSVNNIEAPYGYPGKFRFLTGANQILVNVVASLRSDEDFGLEIGSYDTPQIKPVFGSFFTFWGTPADKGHDGQRCKEYSNNGVPSGCMSESEFLEAGGEKLAFLTNPVDCAEEALRPPQVTINVNTWQNPGLLFSDAVPLEPVAGCEELDFKVDKFAFEPDTDDADSPASFTTELELPSEGLLGLDEEGNFDPEARMNPTIKQTVIDLPEGVVLNASAADGLKACSKAQIGYKGNNFDRPNEIRFSKAPNSCPNASKIGTGDLKSSLLAETLSADLFLAEQGDGNPFGSLFAIYLVIESKERGLNIKLPGEVQVNQQTGKQKIVFKDLPPLPFDSLKLRLKGGARSPLAMPTTCGNYTTDATNTPWSAPESGPPLVSPSTFPITEGPNGTACANTPGERPFNVGLNAGTASVQAGAFSDLTFQVTRPDGSQELDTLRFDLPGGLAAKLKGIPYCSEAAIAAATSRDSGKAEQQSPSCPAASRLGRTLSGAGSGPSPFYAPGELYLAGPYKGQPLSVVAITPAVAGPFDLGNVVVRNAISVDPITAQVATISDEIPKVHEGVPLRVRDIRVILDRPGFSLNPTSCAEKLIGAEISGANGAISNLSNRFQVGNCGALAFKPRVKLRLFGGTSRAKYQGVRAVVRPRPGDANISGATVKFPTSAFVAQEHLQNICTRVQWAAEACPKNSVYGRAIAWSPLLDAPLRGTVHLRSSNNLLPDLVADLRGPAHQPIKVEVAIKTDAVKGALRSTVQSAPDAPVSFFRLQTFGGKKGLIVNSRNICKGKNLARAAFRAHNGRRHVQAVPARNAKCAKQRKAKRKAATRRAKRSAHRSKAGIGQLKLKAVR